MRVLHYTDLIIARSLPLILAVLLVVGVALSLGVVLHLLPVLGDALLLVLCVALISQHCNINYEILNKIFFINIHLSDTPALSQGYTGSSTG